MHDGRHEVEVAGAQTPLLARQALAGRRSTLRRTVPRRVPPLRHRPVTHTQSVLRRLTLTHQYIYTFLQNDAVEIQMLHWAYVYALGMDIDVRQKRGRTEQDWTTMEEVVMRIIAVGWVRTNSTRVAH